MYFKFSHYNHTNFSSYTNKRYAILFLQPFQPLKSTPQETLRPSLSYVFLVSITCLIIHQL